MTTIRDVMTPDPISITPETALGDAVALLIGNDISGVPVVDAAGAIAGILTEKDLLKAFQDPAARVADLMTRDPTAFPVDAELVDVVDCLMANDFRRVLIHENGRLVGLVSRADLMPAILAAIHERSA